MWTVEVRRNMRHAETVERNSDQGPTDTSPHHFSQNFFVSSLDRMADQHETDGFARTPVLPPLSRFHYRKVQWN